MSFFQEELASIQLSENSEIVKCIKNNHNEEYNGYAKLYCPDVGVTTFLPVLAVNKNNNIIENSNSYLTDPGFRHCDISNIFEYDSRIKIFSGLQAVLNKIQELPALETIDEPMFLLLNPFGGRNVGHDLSILFHRIHTYKTKNLSMPVIVGESMLDFPFTLDICKILLPNATFFMLKKNTVVEFNNIYITHNVVFDINLHTYLHDEIIKHCIETSNDIDNFKNKKVCLIKNTFIQKNIVTKSTSFYSKELINILETKYDYVILNPETLSTSDLILYLYFSSKILVSYGAIMYGNAIFFNKSAQLFYITLIGNDYPPYYDAHRYTWVRVNDINLDNEKELFIKSIGEKPLYD
jgi:hypothetical protein